MKRATLLLFGIFLSASIFAQTPSISEKTKGLEVTNGYFDYYYDEAGDQLWLKVDRLNDEFLYANYLCGRSWLNDIGFRRSQQGGAASSFILEKRGSKLMLIQPNLDYIARSDNELEKKVVREAFWPLQYYMVLR